MFRLFVGIALPDDVRLELAELCSGLPGARWVDPGSMHLTLRFIGEVAGDLAEEIDTNLQRVSAPAFDIVIQGVGCFHSGGKVHTLWSGVDKQPLLPHLRDKIESAVVRAGCEAERRNKFKAHITLARFRNIDGARVAAFIQQNNQRTVGPLHVDQFTLFRSHLGGDRPYYERIAEYDLVH